MYVSLGIFSSLVNVLILDDNIDKKALMITNMINLEILIKVNDYIYNLLM